MSKMSCPRKTPSWIFDPARRCAGVINIDLKHVFYLLFFHLTQI